MPDPVLILHALNRFGLGARPGDAARAAGDPRGFVAAQLASADPTALPVRLPTSAECYVQQRQADMARERERAKTPAVATPAAPPPAPPPCCRRSATVRAHSCREGSESLT